ncbi:MAG: YesL family protein [Butyrivibrio sp.]|nr:YesL family protein [Butyrivibrio sp.]
MKTIFDHKIFTVLAGLVDIVWISILWYLGSVLVFTAGAATVAMYYTIHKRLKNEGYLFETYKEAFLSNFKKATVIWLICLALDIFLGFDIYLTRMAMAEGSSLGALYYPLLVCAVMAFMWQIAVFSYQSRFDDSIKAVFAKSSVLAMNNIGWMIFLTAFLIGFICLCRYFIFLFVILPGGYFFMVHHVFEHIFGKMGWIEVRRDDEDTTKL